MRMPRSCARAASVRRPSCSWATVTCCAGAASSWFAVMSFRPSCTRIQRTPGLSSASRSKRASALGPTYGSAPSCSRRLPAMPPLAIPMPMPANAGSACRRAASASGQRASWSSPAPMPSAIESPTMASVPPAPPPSTSTSARNQRVSSFFAAGRSGAAVASPGTPTYAVCSAAPWTVAAGTLCGRYRLTASGCSAGTARSTGSLSTLAPGAIVVPGRPPKVSCRSLEGAMRAPPVDSATRAVPMASGAVPYRFDRRTRTRLPATLVRTTWRSVCAASAGPAESSEFDQPVRHAPSGAACAGRAVAASRVQSSRAARARAVIGDSGEWGTPIVARVCPPRNCQDWQAVRPVRQPGGGPRTRPGRACGSWRAPGRRRS